MLEDGKGGGKGNRTIGTDRLLIYGDRFLVSGDETFIFSVAMGLLISGNEANSSRRWGLFPCAEEVRKEYFLMGTEVETDH